MDKVIDFSDIDDPDVLRERILHLEARLECLHAALHQVDPVAITALHMVSPHALYVLAVLLCEDETVNIPRVVVDGVLKWADEVEELMRTGKHKRIVKR